MKTWIRKTHIHVNNDDPHEILLWVEHDENWFVSTIGQGFHKFVLMDENDLKYAFDLIEIMT